MKILTTLIILFSLTSLFKLSAQEINIDSRKELLLGTWIFKHNQYFDVMKGNKVQARTGDEIDHTGTWKLSEDGKTFFIMEEGKVVEEMNILFVDNYQFAFNPDKGPEEVVLFKDNQQFNSKQMKKLILGSWKQELDGNTFVYEFNKKGTGAITENEQQTDLKWNITEDGVLEIKKSDESLKFSLKSIGTQRLIYQENGVQEYERFLILKRK